MTVKQEFIVENLRFVPGEWCEGVPAQFVNYLCVVEAEGHLPQVRRVAQGTKAGRYHLISISPESPTIEDARVLSVAKVQFIEQLA